MDSQDFQGWLSAAGRADAGAAARGAGGAVRPERRRGVEGGDRARCGRSPALPALREGGGGFAGQGARSSALPVQGLRQDLQRADRHPAGGPATTRSAGCRSGPRLRKARR